LLQHLPHIRTALAELCAPDDEPQQHLFAVCADRGNSRDINDELTLLRITRHSLRHASQLIGPGRDELTFQDQQAHVFAVCDGNLQHAYLKGKRNAKRVDCYPYYLRQRGCPDMSRVENVRRQSGRHSQRETERFGNHPFLGQSAGSENDFQA
jgi:hypothetical protein